MRLSDKYDALLARHMALKDTCSELAGVLRAVRACAKPKEAKELDEMVARDPHGTDSALAIMITPAVWSALTRLPK